MIFKDVLKSIKTILKKHWSFVYSFSFSTFTTYPIKTNTLKTFTNWLFAATLICSFSIIQAQEYTISGYVRDASNGESLIGSFVFVTENGEVFELQQQLLNSYVKPNLNFPWILLKRLLLHVW